MSKPYRDRVLLAARDVDWKQVVLNGGPPCFHVEEGGRFCGRAKRWEGHGSVQTFHEYVSLHAMLMKLSNQES